MNERVLAIVVTWNCRAQALALVDSLLAQQPLVPAILVVDNASADGTAEAVAQRPGVEVLQLGENTGGAGGFATGMGIGIERGCDWLWLLDGDACATPHALSELLAEARRHPPTAAFGSRIVMANHRRVVQECGGMLDRWSGRPRFRHAFTAADREIPSEEVDYLAACSLLVRTEVAAVVGGFDPALFVFFDDIEWALRVRAAGWRLRTAPRSIVHHPFHGGKAPRAWRLYYGARNQIVVHRRHRRGFRRWLVTWVWSTWAERWARRWARRGRPDLASAIRAGVGDALRGHLGRRDEWPSEPPPPATTLSLPASGAVRLLASGELTLELGLVDWWRLTQAHRGQLEIQCDPAAPLAKLLCDEPLVRMVVPGAPPPRMAIVIDDGVGTPDPTRAVARWTGEALVPVAAAPGSRSELLSCAWTALGQLFTKARR